MGSASTGVLRLARAWVAVALTLAVAGVAHSVGGGAVSAAAVGVLAVLLMPLALVAARVRWTAGASLVGLGTGQVLVHVLLSAMEPSAEGYAVAAHLAHGAALGGPAGGLSSPGIHPAHDPALTSAMLWAHVIGTIVTALLVGYAEDALWAVLARLLPQRRLPARLPVGAPAGIAGRAPARLRGIPVGAVAGRGPPHLSPA